MTRLNPADFETVLTPCLGHYFRFRFSGFVRRQGTKWMLTLEICLEPCLSGFDVGIYEVSRTGHPELIEPKRQAHSTDHRLATKMALAIANELYSGYSADNQRITQPEGL